ncbi:MAG: hypothetical protein P4L55_21190 [Syntrophobacteraceae bacterium]|nr:hypothetical protein [Syntrophobacteraceae bacterium]
MDNSFIEQIVSHLEFLGYEVHVTYSEGDKVEFVSAKHPYRSNILFRPYLDGFLFQLFYATHESTKDRYDEFLDYVNNLNKCASIARMYCDDNRDLVIEAWLSPIYDKVAFGRFIDAWDNDARVNLAKDNRTSGFLI